ncbi:uncharacterized protein LOC116770896 [Danaus plexippus]|uniref:uncharacterized protein LOC116770896 n=1 Tax=Danaus plexippus TaxID=13037 RepID=UPI002AB08A10|nr:uncharacterized protein LOC116770896 [Danaus plexippus]
MWLRSLGSSYNLFMIYGILILLRKNLAKCNPITNSNFNEHIREFSLKEDNISSVNIKTLHKEDPKRYADTPFSPIRFKDVPDNKFSGSSHSRGLINREHPGYVPHDYEEYPQVSYDYHIPEVDHHQGNHHIGHHIHGYHDGHYDYGYHYKHNNHALAAKAVLLPLAGIALLGAAAALVSNPILLQLGVATGKRKRRDTEEVSEADLSEENWRIPDLKEHKSTDARNKPCKSFKTKYIRKNYNSTPRLLSKINPTTHSPINMNALLNTEDDDMIPVPIKLKSN